MMLHLCDKFCRYLFCIAVLQTITASLGQQTEVYTDYSRSHAFPSNIVDNKTRAALQSGFVPSRYIPQGVCDYCLDEGVGNLTSNNYPLKYPTNHDCTFRIKKAHKNICAVRLLFHDFDIEHSRECYKDKLIVDGVSYCGDSWRGETKVVQFFKRDEVRLNFVTDNSGSGRGFWIEAEPVSCADGRTGSGGRSLQNPECEEVFREKEFTMNTDNDCTYYIRKAPLSGICGVQFRVANIGMNCNKDYMSIDGGRDKLCYSKTVPFDGEMMVLSTKGSPGRGKIRARQTNDCPLAPPPLCDICTERISDDLTSYGYAVSQYYRNNLLCKMTISRPSNMFCSVKVYFKDFDVEESPNCDKDFLLIDEQRICGTELHGQSRILEYNNEGNVELVFRTDSQNSGRGFHLRFQQLACTSLSNQPTPKVHRCAQTFMSKEFSIQSPRFPNNYLDNTECKYTVVKASPDTCYLELTYTSFNLEDSRDCSKDFLEIAGERHCGSLPADHMHLIPFVDGDKVIRFHSDSSNPNKGFSIRARQLSCGSRRIGTGPTGRKLEGPVCNNETPFNALTFEIESPGYPEAYANGQSCAYTIQKNNPKVCRLQVTFADFSLPPSDTCQGDHLSIDDLRVCGSVVPGTIRIFDMKEDSKKIEFHSDNKTTERGFRLLVKQVECDAPAPVAEGGEQPVQCDRVYSTREAVITSVGYPNSYDNNLNCAYTIRKAAASVCRLELVFQKFDVESSTDCEYDYLQVGSEKLCGVFTQNTSGIYEFDEPEKILKFHSDAANSRPGFHIKMRQIDCGKQEEEGSGGFEDFPDPPVVSNVVPRKCDKVFTSKLFDIRSVDYPSGYPGNLDCKYIIFQANSDVCRLEFTFIDFDMESDCQSDYLEIEGERFCGNLLADTKKVIPFRSAQKIVRLRTDPVSSRPGFHIKVKQVECPSSVLDRPSQDFSPDKSDDNVNWKPTKNWSNPAPADNVPEDYGHGGTGHRHGDGEHFLDHSPGPCKYEFSDHSGVFYSQNFPGPYPNRMSCRYKIKAKPGHCQVELNFVQFRLDENGAIHPSETCDHDYMELNGIKYCHRQLEGQIRTLEFDGHPPMVEMKFFTDEEAHGKGFLGFYRQLPCRGHPDGGPGRPVIQTDPLPDTTRSHQPPNHLGEKRQPSCDKLYALADFNIESPGYPGAYLGGLDCKYFVRRSSPDVCSLAVSFQKFDISESPGCFFDYLEIDGEKICGHVATGTVRMVPLKDFQTGFVFHSNEGAPQGSRQGFLLNVRQIPCGGEPNVHVNGGRIPEYPPQYTRTDSVPPPPLADRSPPPHYPPQPHHVHHGAGGYVGSYGRFGSPQRPPGTNYLDIPRRDMYRPPYRPDLYPDGQRYYPSRPGSYPPGADHPHGISGHGPHGPHGAGPTLPGKGQCDQMIHEPYFEIKSNEFLGNHIDCRFTIYQQSRESGMCLEILFVHFQIDCDYDQMRIDDQQLCGTIPPNSVRQYKFHDYSRPLYLYFHSSSGVKASDFIVRGRQSPCSGIPGGSYPTQDRSDPYHPQSRPGYDPNRPGHNKPAQPPYDKPIGGPYDRPYDRPGYDRPFDRPMMPRPTTSPPFDRPDHRPFDGQNQRHPNCDATFSGLEFKITSPGFPSPYSGGDCKYTVRRYDSATCAIEVYYDLMDLEPSGSCNSAYLEIEGQRLCSMPSRQIQKINFNEPQSEKVITFHADRTAISHRGFSLRVRQVTDCAAQDRPFGKEAPLPPSPLCDYCQREAHGQFASPNYPSPYGANARCSYRIEPVEGYCQVEMYWHDFDLESSPGCHKDMVALEGSHYCSNDLKKKSSILDFPSTRHPEIKLMLQSDTYVEGRGFHMEYRQLKCKNSTATTAPDASPTSTQTTGPVPEALTFRKSSHEQSVKTALFVRNNDNTTSSRRLEKKARNLELEREEVASDKGVDSKSFEIVPGGSMITESSTVKQETAAPSWTRFAKPTPAWR